VIPKFHNLTPLSSSPLTTTGANILVLGEYFLASSKLSSPPNFLNSLTNSSTGSCLPKFDNAGIGKSPYIISYKLN
jgi:hypothetical protein